MRVLLLMVLLSGQVIPLLTTLARPPVCWRIPRPLSQGGQLGAATGEELGCVSRAEASALHEGPPNPHRTVSRLRKGAFQEDETPNASAYRASARVTQVSAPLAEAHVAKPGATAKGTTQGVAHVPVRCKPPARPVCIAIKSASTLPASDCLHYHPP